MADELHCPIWHRRTKLKRKRLVPMIAFFSLENLPLIKQRCLRFQSVAALGDPFLVNRRVYEDPQEPLSDAEFEAALRPIYDALEPHIRAMVEWNYYLEKAKVNRASFEAQFQSQSGNQDNLLPDSTLLSRFAVLRLFSEVNEALLWQLHGSHDGLALRFDAQHEYFRAPKFDGKPQVFSLVEYDDQRVTSTQAEPYKPLLRQPQINAFEQESRLIRPVSTEGIFRFPTAALTDVYLGLNVDMANVQSVAQWLKMDQGFRHVQAHQMAVSPSHLRLKSLPLKRYLE